MAIIKVITPSVTDANITTAKVTDNAITLGKMASGTDGNIISYDASGNPVAVATGSSGQVLTSAGAGAVPSFQAAAGGGAMVKISTVTASGSATVDFDNVASTYKMYAVVATLITPATNSTSFVMNFGSDGNTYAASKTSAFFHQYNKNNDTDLQAETNATNSLGGATGDQQIGYGLSSTAATAKSATMFAYFTGLAQGGYASYDVRFTHFASNSYAKSTTLRGAVAADVDCIRFKMESGNIASGTFTLYGIDQ